MIYNAALYIRLSKEDYDRSDASLSVVNQKNFLLEYIENHNYRLYDIYIDDGYTGTNFDRPAFQKMLCDIEEGKINLVVTKDLSRLGRDYIDTGKYIEKYFPSRNVRYVALLDGIDTGLCNSNNDMAPFKAVINDMYSRDNSKKIRTALRSMQEKGYWVGACPPLGYMKDPCNKNHLIINNDESFIVKKIFSLANSGLNSYQISNILTKEKIPTASMIRSNKRISYMANMGIWSAKTVKKILSNQLYVGDMVQNRGSRLNYKIRKHVVNDKKDWIIVNNTHEAIIDRKVFDNVQKIINKCRVRSNKKDYRLLDGLLYCHECGHRIMICKPRKSDAKVYIVCNYYRMYSKQKLCTSHSYNYDKLEKIILDKILEILKNNLGVDELERIIKCIFNKQRKDCKICNNITDYDNQILNKQKQLDSIYYDKINNIISDDMYIRFSKKIMSEIDRLTYEKEKNGNNINNELVSNSLTASKVINEFFLGNFLNRKFILKLINRIEIYNDKNIDIYFSFKI